MVISETKLDESFPNGQFKIPAYALTCRLDRNHFGGVIWCHLVAFGGMWWQLTFGGEISLVLAVFVREDISSRVLSLNKSTESLFIELNICKKKWLLCCAYNPNRNNISNHLNLLRRSLDLYSAKYEHFIIAEDFKLLRSYSDEYESFL